MSKSSYVLESSDEFERLERQSQNDAYNYEKELSGFTPRKSANILDAGCGSGIVSRYLAKCHPNANIFGCDFSQERVDQARIHSNGLQNLQFQSENLAKLSFESSKFDAVVCRYVLEHLSQENLSKALNEFYRCLRPNGKVMAIDMDGFIYNIFPQTELMKKVFSKLQADQPLDMHIGRKIPHLLFQSGFVDVSWKLETHSFQGESLETELSFIQERFEQAMPFLKNFLESEKLAQQFTKEYFECARQPGAVLFFNKFIVSGEKPGLRKL